MNNQVERTLRVGNGRRTYAIPSYVSSRIEIMQGKSPVKLVFYWKSQDRKLMRKLRRAKRFHRQLEFVHNISVRHLFGYVTVLDDDHAEIEAFELK